jgi:hypothetical protein
MEDYHRAGNLDSHIGIEAGYSLVVKDFRHELHELARMAGARDDFKLEISNFKGDPARGGTAPGTWKTNIEH